MRMYSIGVLVTLGFVASSLLASSPALPLAVVSESDILSERVAMAPLNPVTAPAPFVSARSYVVFDMASGDVLLQERADEVRSVASLTKLVTAAAVLESPLREESVVIHPHDVVSAGVTGAVQVGESYTLYELLFPLLLTSSNHAADALQRRASALTADMNSLVRTWGTEHTSFADASGLSADNRSTATDLVLILRALYQTHPHVLDISRLNQYVSVERGWKNNSPVVHEMGYRGGKHGYTEAAGRTFAGIFTEVLPSGERELGYVVLGSETLAADIAALRSFVVAEVATP